MEKCNYVGCENNATAKGVIFARNPKGKKYLPTDVYACDKHKKSASFLNIKLKKQTKQNFYFRKR
ncbi:hypothetical protein [Bacillus cereus]|uniref:hypothetical protein n=1 Tax=Bacillus cereus TaxID=1396 RepID=UPI001925C754|nr:hypothetical protein [Bacillus cereus]